MMVKVLLICISIRHGNTLRIAESMAEVAGAEILKPSDVDEKVITNYDIIGLGSGIYYGKHHKSLFKLLDKLELKRKPVFIFYTSGAPKIPLLNGCDKALKKALKRKGSNVIGVFGCRGFSDYGPLKLIGGIHRDRPNEEDLEKSKKFIAKIIETYGKL